MGLQPFEQLEVELTKWCGFDTAVCSTGTAALHLALEAIYEDGLTNKLQNPVCKVIVPDYQFVAVARAVSMRGLRPHFVDVDPRTLNLDVKAVEQSAARSDVVGIIAVSTYGRRAPMDDVIRIAKQHDLFVIEDLAEAHGIHPHPMSDAACWSFFRNKIIPAEEGGAVASRYKEVTDKVRCLRSQGYRPGRFWDHEPRGINARMTNAQALQVLRNLGIVNELLEMRTKIMEMHEAQCPLAWQLPLRGVNWLYDFQIPGLKLEHQQRLVQSVNKAGIYCRPGFSPISLMDEYRSHYSEVSGIRESVSEVLSREVIALDCSPVEMNGKTVERAWEVIRREYGGYEAS